MVFSCTCQMQLGRGCLSSGTHMTTPGRQAEESKQINLETYMAQAGALRVSSHHAAAWKRHAA